MLPTAIGSLLSRGLLSTCGRALTSQAGTGLTALTAATSTPGPSPLCMGGSQSYHAYSMESREVHATTILCVRKNQKVVLIGDGQVSMGSTIVKPNAKKIRRIGEGVVAGFAGSAADGLSLLERLEVKLEEHPGQLMRAAVELAKQWRQDKALRFLQVQCCNSISEGAAWQGEAC